MAGMYMSVMMVRDVMVTVYVVFCRHGWHAHVSNDGQRSHGYCVCCFFVDMAGMYMSVMMVRDLMVTVYVVFCRHGWHAHVSNDGQRSHGYCVCCFL